ncbi:MAG: pyridoxal phosphate-dependent aminotransferase [Myxococcota bacterium]|nr:pyridoxal phosphate-dependent aminotransferase [Myxococcota bacterium]
MKRASFVDDLTPFLAMEVMERGMAMANAGAPVMQLGVGEPDFDAPPEVIEATIQALRDGDTHYTDSRGLRSLRERIARDHFERRGVEIDPNRVIVTQGTSPAIGMVMRLLLEPGDEVIMPTPHYACYPNLIALSGAKAVMVPTMAQDGYAIDVDEVRKAITPRTRAILVASPANPTGAVQAPETLDALANLGLPFLSDEIYHGLVFDGYRDHSPAAVSDTCFIFDGFSKRYAMTGFRLGYVIAPESAARPLQIMQQNLHISSTHFVQKAAVAALDHGDAHLVMMRETYDRRRRLLLSGLRDLGFEVPVAPAGAFYILANAKRFGDDSLELAFEILDKAKVAVGPGRDFGTLAEGHLRFSYAASEATIEESLHRLGDILPKLGERR